MQVSIILKRKGMKAEMKSDQPRPPHIRMTQSIVQLVIILACLYGILTFHSPMIFVLSAIVMAGLILSLMNTLGFYSHPRHKRNLKMNRE